MPRQIIPVMRYINLIFLLLISFCAVAAPDIDSQVRVNGRIASFESVIKYCAGDTAVAESICEPLPVRTPYYNNARVRIEKFYNILNPAWLCVVAAMLCAVIPSATFLSVLLLFLLLVEFATRWWLGDSVPLTSITDISSAIALILCCVALKKLYIRRLIYLIIALLMACEAIWRIHPAVRPVNPALQSYWLPFHVAMMAGAYSLFLISAVSAAAKPVGRRIFMCIVAAEILLAVGIIIGSLWAADAWGSYWSWDPKETAALVTFLIYLIVVTFWKKIGIQPNRLRIAIVLSFVAVVFTWVGVSGGLHAY